MNVVRYGALFVAFSLSTATFAQAGNGAGPAGGGAGNTPAAGGQSGAASGQTGGIPTNEMKSGRAAAESPASGMGMSGQQRMGDGANGSNSNNGVNGNTTGMGNAQTTNPANQQ